MPNVDSLRFSTITTEARSVRSDTPIRLESVVDLRYDPYSIIDDINNELISPPRDRNEFMNWYFARRLEGSSGMSSRDVQAVMLDAEEVWGIVSGESDDLRVRFERDQLWNRTYSNARDRRKGNAVVAVTIHC